MNVKAYLRDHDAVEIKVGQSGADVYEIDGQYVLKYAARQNLESELFDAYAREALFYQSQAAHKKAYLPEALKAEATENEILILMKKYHRLERGSLDEALIRRIALALAALHTDEAPAFLRQDSESAKPLSAQQIAGAMSGWKSVLAEHPGAFDEGPLDEIAEQINRLILWHDAEERVLIHGDCHWDNLLEDEEGHVLLCDWQGVHLGGASGDLSFLVSRLAGDGVPFDTAVLLDAYVDAVRRLTGRRLDRQAIIGHMNASDVITSFVFWHEYLHGGSEERVRDIYGKMARSLKGCGA